MAYRYTPPKMMPGQELYSEEEYKKLEKLLHLAALGDPGEEDEREILQNYTPPQEKDIL